MNKQTRGNPRSLFLLHKQTKGGNKQEGTKEWCKQNGRNKNNDGTRMTIDNDGMRIMMEQWKTGGYQGSQQQWGKRATVEEHC